MKEKQNGIENKQIGLANYSAVQTISRYSKRHKRSKNLEEIQHLEREKDNKYKELLEVMEEEVKLSNNEMEGQLEIPGIKKVRNR